MRADLSAVREGDSWSDEARLVQAARADPAAAGALYESYVDRVYWYLRARLPSEEDAHDLTQQVFVQMLSALPRYQAHRAPFAVWLFGIARHVAADHFRRHRSTIPWDLVPPAQQPHAPADPDAPLLRREDSERLARLIAQLAPQVREMLALRFAARLTAAEIAAVIGKSEAATQKQLARAIQTLKEKYRDTH